jgi:hypothetical protein
MANEPVQGNLGEFVIDKTEDGRTRVQVRFVGETVWLSQKAMAELFQKDVRTISEHISNIFEEGELYPDSVIRNFRITAADGKQYDTQHYNLDVIISVGYRVKSLRGTQFRIWATQRLREYIIKGFTLDDERLKKAGGGDHFEELLVHMIVCCLIHAAMLEGSKLCNLSVGQLSFTHALTETRLFLKKLLAAAELCFWTSMWVSLVRCCARYRVKYKPNRQFARDQQEYRRKTRGLDERRPKQGRKYKKPSPLPQPETLKELKGQMFLLS